MSEEFTLQYRAQQEWGWLAVLDFFLAGGGAGLYLVAIVLGLSQALPFGLAAAAVGALILLADLGRPERFWRAISRPGTSWISRGVILVTLFLVFGTVSIAYLGSPGSGIYILSVVIAVLAAIGVTAYTGFVLAESPGVPAWHGALLPAQFVLLSLVTGIGGFYLLLPLANSGLTMGLVGRSGIAITYEALELVGLALCLAAVLMLIAYLVALRSSSAAARQARQELIRGQLAVPFFGGVFLSLVAPIIVLAYMLTWRAGFHLRIGSGPVLLAPDVLLLLGASLVAGALLIRYCLLKVGYYAPVVEPLAHRPN